MRSRALVALSFSLFSAACGYHVAGKADLVPKNIKTICIPAWGNNTTRYRLTDRLPENIAREFIARTRYKVVSDINSADAVLTGAVLNYVAIPTIYDAGDSNRPGTGRASGVQVIVTMQVTLTDRTTGKVIFTRPTFEAKERYEISIDPKAYFEESDAALDRLARDVSKTVVSAILENF